MPRRARLRHRRRDRPQEVGLPHQQILGDWHARRARWHGLCWHFRQFALHGAGRKTGRLRFDFKAGAHMFSSAALADELAYVGDHNGRLYAIDAKAGKLAWAFQTEAPKKDSMKILNPDGTLNQEAFAPIF